MITGSAYLATLPDAVDDVEGRLRLMHARNVAEIDTLAGSLLVAPAERWPALLDRLTALTDADRQALRADPLCDRVAFLIGAAPAPDRRSPKRSRKPATPDGV